MQTLAFIAYVALLFAHESSCLVSFSVRNRRATGDATLPNLQGSLTSGYYVTVQLGTPPQELNVILDTGSSNFAIAGAPNENVQRYFNQSESTSAKVIDASDITIAYTEGSWQGLVIKDKLSINSAGLTQPVYVPLAVIKSAQKFFVSASKWEGILGLAYSELVQPHDLHLTSVMEAIVSKSSNVADMFSMQLCSIRNSVQTEGSFILGAVNTSLAKEQIYWTRIVRNWYYDVVITAIKVGGQVLDLNCRELNNDRTIVDSGTTNLRFPTSVYMELIKKINETVKRPIFGESFYSGTEMYCSPLLDTAYNWFPNITLYFPSLEPNKTFPLVVYPQNYLQFESNLGEACFKFAIFPSETGTVIGTVLMEQYYVVFDRANSKVGFALSSCSLDPLGRSLETVELDYSLNSTTCRYVEATKVSKLRLVAYVLLGMLVLAFIPMCTLLCINCYRHHRLCCKPKSDQMSDTSGLLTSY